MAIAAFLGESGPYRQIVGTCCVNVTNWDRYMTFRRSAARASGFLAWVFHNLATPMSGRIAPESGLSRRLFAVGFEPRVDQRDDPVDHRMAQTLLLGDQLHQLVGALDIGRAVL